MYGSVLWKGKNEQDWTPPPLPQVKQIKVQNGMNFDEI